MNDVYHNPEVFGLTQIAIVEEDESYQFNMIVAWRDESGRVYWGHDTGCSCPSPFEDYTSKESLNLLRAESLDALAQEVDGLSAPFGARGAFMDTVKAALAQHS